MGVAQAQVTLPHLDAMNYTSGTALGVASGWAALNSGDAINVASGNLSYFGLPTSTGNKISFDGVGMEGVKIFTQQTTGTVYWSFLVNVTALGSLNTTGGYFAGLNEGTASNFGATIWARSDGAGYDLGINPRTTAANTQWSSGTTSINNTLLVVVSYTIVSGTGNDVVKMWINPQLGGTEPTPTLTATNTGGTDLLNINRILLRQDGTTTTPFIEMDEFRIGTSWTDVTPAGSSPTVTPSVATLTGFTTTAGTASAAQTFAVTGSNLTANVTVTAPTGFEVATDGAAFADSKVLTKDASGAVSGTISVRIAAATAQGSPSGNVTLASTSATTANVAVSGTVTAAGAAAVSVTGGTLTAFSTVAGTASAAQSFTVSGSNLNSDITVTAPSGFEVSTDAASYASSKTLTQVSRTVAATTISVRIAASTAAGALASANVTIEATDVTTANVAVSGTVTQPALTLVLDPTTVAENAGASASTGTVGIPTALSSNLVVSLLSSNTAAATVPSTVTITAGQTNATFPIAAVVYNANTPVSVTITASSTSYTAASAPLTLTDVPTSADLTASGYLQDFSTFTTTQQALPIGWALNGTTVSFTLDPVASGYGLEWGITTGTAPNPGTGGGLRAQTLGGILGYQHTSSTGTLIEVLTLKNATANTITDLTISYKGRVARADQTRNPIFSVKVDTGTAIAALAYDTTEGDNIAKSAVVSGLNIQPGATFTINWSSARGGTTGSAKQIGLSDVNVAIGSNIFPPSIGLVSLVEATLSQTSATINGSVTADGGATISERGFVYSLTSVSANPEIGGSGVTKIVDSAVTVDLLSATLTGLAANSGYSVRAYAINGQGTTYSTALNFTTLQNNPDFTGNYAQDFSTFSSMTTFPSGWRCLSDANVYAGDFITSATSSAGFLGGTSIAGVLGYQHTSGSGTLANKLTLLNGTGSTLSTLYVSYQGKVALTSNTRTPAWTVKVNETVVADLAYSTANGVDEVKTAQITGLSVAAGESFTISWESDRGTGSGSSRRIGIANVKVSTTPIIIAPVISSPLAISGNVGTAITPYSIIASQSPTSYGATGLPDGLGLDPITGQITGTPLAATDGTVVQISATNSAGTGTAQVTVIIDKGNPFVTQNPIASAITAGQTLGTSILSVGAASVDGTYAWTTPSTVPAVGTASYGVTFTPTDAVNYNTFTTTVSVTVNPAESTFADWSGGATLDSAGLAKYAIGGASSLTANDGVKPTTTLTGGSLVITAIVRTDNSSLTVVGQAVTDLANYASGTGVTTVNGVETTDQTGVPTGHKRKTFSVAQGSDAKKFMRLIASLALSGVNTTVTVAKDSGGATFLQVTGATAGATGGGTATSDKRSLYYYAFDTTSSPTFSGGFWPYVIVRGQLSAGAGVTATLTKNSSGVLLVNGLPAYQFGGDSGSTTASGVGSAWPAMRADGSKTTTGPTGSLQ